MSRPAARDKELIKPKEESPMSIPASQMLFSREYDSPSNVASRSVDSLSRREPSDALLSSGLSDRASQPAGEATAT